MRRLAAALALALAAGGCQALPLAGAAGAGAGAAWVVTAQADVKAADTVLATDAPLKEIACDVEQAKSHGPVTTAFLKTYCANVPTSVLEAGVTWAKVIAAMAAAERAQEGAP